MPPGRAGRLWLKRRLEIARRGRDVLEQKRRVLFGEERRLRHLVEETGGEWKERCQAAETWLLRAVLLGGERQIPIARAHLDRAAGGRVVWRSAMGLAFPAEVDCELPSPIWFSLLGNTSALEFAASAHRRALTAAVEHAAARRALELISAELDLTVRRLRAVEQRWIPRLESALHDLELALEERERDETVHARWARERRQEEAAL
jgi:V/A-type H+-transporting ATPase subunit D